MSLPKPYYQDSAVTLYHGDCREIVPLLGRFDATITDPPYGVNFTGNQTKHTKKDGVGYASFDDSKERVIAEIIPLVELCISVSDRCVLTPGLNCMFEYPNPRAVGWIYYPSGANSGPWGFVCGQPIFYYGKDPYLEKQLGSRPNCFSTTEAAEQNGHPCPKAIGQMMWLVNRGSLEGMTVLDPFAGSGTTGRACKDLGRKCVMIEREEKYCEIAARRMGQEVLNFT